MLNYIMEVDIVTGVRDGEKFILQAIDSIQRQSVTNWKYFIVDDGSTDATVEIARTAIAKDKRITYVAQESMGISKAINTGMRMGRAPYIAFVDADDLWHPEKLEKQLTFLEQRLDINYCFTMIREFDEQENMGQHNFRARPDVLKGYLRSSLCCRRCVLESYGYCDESVSMGDFLDWLSPAINAGEELAILNEVLAYRRVHGDNMTALHSKRDYLGVLKKHLERKQQH